MGFWLNLASVIFLVITNVIDKMADDELKELENERLDDIKEILVKDDNDVTIDVVKKRPCFNFDDCKGLSNLFWLNNFSNMGQMTILMGYLQFAEESLVSRWGYTEARAALFTVVPYLMGSCLAPCFGALVDRVGKRLSWCNAANIICTLSQVWALSVPHCKDCEVAVIPLFLLGVSNLMVYNLQQGSIVAFTVPPERLGIAFGIMYCCMNTAQTLTPTLLGAAEDHGGFEAVFFILFLFGLASTVTSFMMWHQDKKHQNGLLQVKNPYELMGLEGQAHRSVVLSVAN